jgi:hypothetical protein
LRYLIDSIYRLPAVYPLLVSIRGGGGSEQGTRAIKTAQEIPLKAAIKIAAFVFGGK